MKRKKMLSGGIGLDSCPQSLIRLESPTMRRVLVSSVVQQEVVVNN